MSPVFALVDCNNFYVSCERVFCARLLKRAIVVLSNNDGCVIARSEEAKLLGIGMGTPAFHITRLIETKEVEVFSSNYALYGDMSARVMETLREFTPEVEIYSIDEAFLHLPEDLSNEEYVNLGQEIRAKVRKWTGIPVTVGIAETKTLAKLAARVAKKSERAAGVVNLARSPHVERALQMTNAEDVWGIGRQHARMLKGANITTALALRNAPDKWIKRRMSVVGLRTVFELRGTSCLPLEFCPPPKKSITVSRSFGRHVETLADMREAVSHFTARAAEKLRRAEMIPQALIVFLSTNKWNDAPQYASSAVVHLPVATDYTPELIRAAHRGIERIYVEGYTYKKAGVVLVDLVPVATAQCNFFGIPDTGSARSLMGAIDKVNAQFGRGTLRFAAGFKQGWKTRAEHRQPRYTTHWGELLTLNAAI